MTAWTAADVMNWWWWVQTAGGSTRDPGVDTRTEGEAVRGGPVAGSPAEDEGQPGERHRRQGVESGHWQARVHRPAQERLHRPVQRRSQFQHDSQRILNPRYMIICV